MKRYYCPYCNPKYQIHEKSETGELICGLCGDPLVNKPYIKINQIIAIIAAFSFAFPLIYTLIILIKSQVNSPSKSYQVNLNSKHKVLIFHLYQPLQSDFFKQDELYSL